MPAEIMANTPPKSFRMSERAKWLLAQGSSSIPCSETAFAEMAIALYSVDLAVNVQKAKQHLFDLLCKNLLNDPERISQISAHRSNHHGDGSVESNTVRRPYPEKLSAAARRGRPRNESRPQVSVRVKGLEDDQASLQKK